MAPLPSAIALLFSLFAGVLGKCIWPCDQRELYNLEWDKPSLGSTSTTASIYIDWGQTPVISKTTTTLQVVSNPILDREFTAANGTKFQNPIHDAAWKSLADLNADLVRYVPWFPYPKKSVAELDAPNSSETSWNFLDIIPNFYDFMEAVYGKNKSTVINFSTQPCWLFKNSNCSYPSNPDQSFFGYVRGKRSDLLDPTAKTLAKYYARLLSWMINGSFIDENGKTHTAPLRFDLSSSKGHVWELFNEGEHGYTAEYYTHDYDVVVSAMIEAVGKQNAPKFMGIGGASPSWIPFFLNKSNHVNAPNNVVPPIDYVSVHFYASCSSRTDPTTYSSGFFGRADSFISEMGNLIKERDASDFPTTKFDLDELGVIMPDDNNPNYPLNASLPDVYWNAAGAMYAYLFGNLAQMGVETLGHSQLAGSPSLPQWNIPLPQYPSVSLLDWRTGFGNARYWVLKLLIDQFQPGDQLFKASVLGTNNNNSAGTNPFCGTLQPPNSPGESVTLQCVESNATMIGVDFADWGLIKGACGDYSKGSCTCPDALSYVQKLCLGNNSCTLIPYPTLGDPCQGIPKQFAAQVRCSGTKGGTSSGKAPQQISSIYAMGALQGGTSWKVLVINKELDTQQVAAPIAGVLYVVDPESVSFGSNAGIRNISVEVGDMITLNSFAVGVFVETDNYN
eukprot:m.25773 g.25773  ORF g.25773 m.25773 type:complete len:676 (+) comp7738_c0_seq2:7-2034(+)